QNQPRRDDFGLKIGKLSHRTSIKDGLGRHIGSCGPLNRNFLNFRQLCRVTGLRAKGKSNAGHY
ncbi:hypothetical protein, partial [Enterobacter cloacae complex sp. IR5422]|uniref:hypothetical protein n=1 Tax=Enterobacter cloacae complex sp. IR5422 TaxID=3412363 RepID=UPI003B9FF4A3